jgi:hypothetical protein
MPKILVDASKGLHQTSGNSTTNGTISGHKKHVVEVDGAQTLTNADSGKLFVLGTTGGAITFPMTQGWNAEFLLTGSISANYNISGSAVSPAASVTGSFRIVAEDGASAGIIESGGNTGVIRFVSTKAAEGDIIKIDVLSSTRVYGLGVSDI